MIKTVGGDMPERVMCWKKGNTKVFTKRIDLAEKAIDKGHFVTVLKDKPRIFTKFR